MVFNVEEYEQKFCTEENTTDFQNYPGLMNDIRQLALSYWRAVFKPEENNKTY